MGCSSLKTQFAMINWLGDFNITKKKLKLRSFMSNEHINEKGDGPYRGFDYKSLVNDSK